MSSPRHKTVRLLVDDNLSATIRDGYSSSADPVLSGNPWLTKFADCAAEVPLLAESWQTLEQKMPKDNLCF